MGGISSSVGIFSGIDTGALIEQLLAIEARPKAQAQNRVGQLKLRQVAFLDINSRLSGLRAAAKAFGEVKTFQTKGVTSSDTDVLTAKAGTSAAAGSYTFIVDRLVSAQQRLSRGFVDKDASGLGLTELRFESARARLDRDAALADLNSGEGVKRGKITVTDSGGRSATVDLSKAVTVNDVLEAINANGTAKVTASVRGGAFVIKDQSGGTVTIADAAGSETATSLGLAGTATGTLTGGRVYGLHGGTAIGELNDGNGVSVKNTIGEDAHSFRIQVGGASPATVSVNIGDVWKSVAGKLEKTEGAVTTAGGAIKRINDALAAAGVTGVTASIDATNGRLLVTDGTGSKPVTITENGDTTAADLGLTTAPVAGSVEGRRVLAGLNTSLARGLNGGAGIGGDGELHIVARDGAEFDVTIDPGASLTDIFAQVEAASGVGANGKARISLALDAEGTGITLTDNTGGSLNLIVEGNATADTASSLGIQTVPGGIAAASTSSGNLQRKYVGTATLLSSLNDGRGVGTGKFRVTDSVGGTAVIDIGDDTKTIGQFMQEFNGQGLKAKARINANGDGIEIYEDNTATPAGGIKIKIADESGSVAKALNIAGTAKDTGVLNVIDGSYERVLTFSAADTLQKVADTINRSNVGASAAIIKDGAGATPFRLNLAATGAGRSGRFIVDAGAFDLGLRTLDAGEDARVFFGSTDPAKAVVVTGSSNSVDGLVPGVKIDLKGASTTAVTLNVTSDVGAIEAGIGKFIAAFNTAVGRIDQQSSYDKESNRRGPLLGDSTALELKAALYRTVQGRSVGATGAFEQLADIGVNVGKGGVLELDADRLRAALASDPASVEALFTARVAEDDSKIDLGDGVTATNPNAGSTFSTLGLMGQIEELVDRYVDGTDGVLTSQTRGIDTQIALQNSRIVAMDLRLENKRTVLQRQFLAMEKALAQMQSQQSSINQIGK